MKKQYGQPQKNGRSWQKAESGKQPFVFKYFTFFNFEDKKQLVNRVFLVLGGLMLLKLLGIGG